MLMKTSTAPVSLDRGAPRWALLGVGLLVAAWLLSPMLTPVHPEGFTASVASLALHLNRDSLGNFDALQPLNLEYFGLTKLGWVLSTALLTGVFHLKAVTAMTLLMWASSAAFAGGTIWLVRKWTQAPALLIAAGLVVIPGISESAFFFNDNMLASACAVLGLCALYSKHELIGPALSGALFGLAVLTRADTVLIAPVLPLILLERFGWSRRTLSSSCIVAAAGAAALLGALALFHASIFDVFQAASAAVSAWDRLPAGQRIIPLLLYFLGLPAVLLAAFGLVPLVERRSWLEAARLLIVPTLYCVLLGSKIWELRQLLPLAPFLVALAVLGFRGIFTGEGTRGFAVLRGAVMGLVAVSLFGPITAPGFADGPRALLGRASNIQHWREWQQDVGRDLDLVRRLARRASSPGAQVIFVDAWNEDRYMHLALQEAGFAVQPAAGPGECGPITEHFVRGASVVHLVRLQQSYVPYWRQISGERLRRWGIPCVARLGSPDVTFVASDQRAMDLFNPDGADGSPTASSTEPAAHVPLRAIRLGPAGLSRLLHGYEREARELALGGEVTGTVEQGAAATRRRTSFGR